MKLLAFAASNSRHSINAALVAYAAERFRAQHLPALDVEMLDLNDYEMALYSPEREAVGLPPEAQAFFDKIGSVDALMISYAEHNGLYTAAWKNTFDWMSRIDGKVFQDRPMVVFATSPGSRGGANVLKTAETSAPFFGADIVGSVSIAHWGEAYDADARALTRDADVAAVDAALAALAAALSAD